jgi:hypothetical protein
MEIYLVAVESTNANRNYSKLGDKLKDKGDDCQALDNVWYLRSNESAQEIFDFLKNGIVHPLDRILVVSINAPWLCQNSQSQGDCFDLNPTPYYFDLNPKPLLLK